MSTANMTTEDYTAYAAANVVAVQNQLNFVYIQPGSTGQHIPNERPAVPYRAKEPQELRRWPNTAGQPAAQQYQVQRQRLAQLQQQKQQLQSQRQGRTQREACATQVTQGAAKPQQPRIAFGR